MTARLPVNAVRREVIDYVGDPAADARQARLAGMIIASVQGRLVRAYRGDNSDPSRSFNGWGPQLQRFGDASTGAANGVVYGNVLQSTLENQPGGEPTTDPVQRLLINRLRRQM